ncbi:MAG TPA: hypothetical protein DCZ94_13830 [Lentisphaeria bacterium]|nr:MAG: hypothetical protein A2X48_15655 [Lentisphaerae bacterium GWF2_49_21]HBC88026.1 hypothetical protein [Lentisphaeria bacterium]
MKNSFYIFNNTLLFAALFLLMSAAFAAEHENLIVNGSFDKGEKTPDNWEAANGLTSFYINEEGRGRIVKMDSRVDRMQSLAWMKKFKEDPTAAPPEPVYSKDKYACIGGNEGVWVDSGLIDVKPGQNYKLTVDYKGPSSPIVWIKGFLFHPVRKDYADAYQTRLVPDNPDKEKWKTYSIGFNPTDRTPKVEKMKVRIYAYWPAGIYYFDNVKVEEITPEEMVELQKKREEVPEKEKDKKK